jgi:LacI family transcriptional regulator
MKKVTLSDIARETGFSIKTVSRVINEEPNVKEETRRIIKEVITKKDYSVNIMAKALKSKTTKTIIVFIDKHSGGYWNAWHSLIMKDLILKFKERGFKVIFSPSSGKDAIEDETDGFELLKSGIADGALIFDNMTNDIRIKYLMSNGIPFVIVGKDLDSQNTSYVDLDNYMAGFKGANYLIGKKCERILFFLGYEVFTVDQERARGFKNACEKANVDYKIVFNIDKIDKLYSVSKEIINEFNPDGIFVSGDEKAIALYKSINELKKKIPEDIMVLGIDNLPQSRFLYPSLSSVDQNVDQFSSKLVNLLIEMLYKKNVKAKRILIDPKIIERESTLR